ncbi:MAG TPA: cytochrome c biogenesis protein CcsA [Blastocatellia bacterium]|nr:cytochrome c biogenesis protein CcsA [Blastocatellia bacterium]
MSRAIKQANLLSPGLELSLLGKVVGLWQVIATMLGAGALIAARFYLGPRGFLYEGALTMLALIGYLSAAVLLVTNLFVKERALNRLGTLTVAMGACFNFSGWMIRWIEAGEAEGWKRGINGVWRYFPLDNLYPLTLGFCFGAAITTLAIIRKPRYQFLGALSMPIVVVILTLGMLLGNDISTLPPILDSYWRPIHVSIATIGYGVCLVSFGLAFAYLLKDGVRSEAIAIAVGLFAMLVYLTVGRFGILPHMEYGASLMIGKSPLPVRAVLPGVGPLMAITTLAIFGSLGLFTVDWLRSDPKAKKLAWRLFRGAVILQAVVLSVLFYQIRNVDSFASRIPQREHAAFGQWLAEQNKMTVPPEHRIEFARDWIAQAAGELRIGMKSNPVEVGGLIGLFVALLLVSLFAWKRDEVDNALPPLPMIDALLYRTVGVAFPLLSLLLITGAVWANESWGRYWGWDSKEVGALVAWMAYAGFLHTRVAHAWRGRRSAYFALLGFALVIFTWLGVSYLLPGLHSYA